MTDMSSSAADRAANASSPDGDTAVAGPELAAPAADAGAELAATPADAGAEVSAHAADDDAELAATAAAADAEVSAASADAPASDEPINPAAADPAPASEPGLDAVPALPDVPAAPDATAVPALPDAPDAPAVPLAAAVIDGEPPSPAKPRRRRSLVLRFGVSFVLGILLTGTAGAGVLYAWGQQYDGRVLPGVSIGNTDLGGLTRAQAEAQIANAYGSLGTGQITLTGPDGQTAIISYADIGRRLDTSALVDAALVAGREGEPLARLIGEPRAAIRGVTLDAAVIYDRDKVAATVESFATAIDRTPSDASVSAGQDGTFSASPAKDGREVDKSALLAALDQELQAIYTPASTTLAVPIVPLAPSVTTASAEAASAAANRMAADMQVVRLMDTWEIARSSLAPLISFSTAADGSLTPVFDESGLDPVLTTLGQQVNQAAQEAGFKLVKDHVVAIDTGLEGRTLDAAGTKAAIMREIGARQAGEAASLVPATVAAVEPALTTTAAEAFAPNMQLISSYSVYYYSIVNNHWGGNIEAPATKIDGTVVPAGAIFDFWKVVGDLRLLPGTGPGNAIEGGKITVTGAFGGGICTTSTTLFNAAFRAGMVPIARQNHNEFISRYPPGLDATVWIVGNTTQTMSFKNDTEFPILITHTITRTGSKRWLTFKIWSVPNGRTTKITDLVVQPGPSAKDTVVEDPTKPVGYSFRNNSAVNGAQVWVTVTIYDHGTVHWTKRYYSKYPAVNGVLIKGTKPVTPAPTVPAGT